MNTNYTNKKTRVRKYLLVIKLLISTIYPVKPFLQISSEFVPFLREVDTQTPVSGNTTIYFSKRTRH